ncbi:hypothetical protein VNO77_02986 [Canavalia gladiata]|uniref:Uncharacterized protein n=1 Tax=Canavalia gladiata TaxID=3824 RepID=A0AAN9R3H0_CANGL
MIENLAWSYGRDAHLSLLIIEASRIFSSVPKLEKETSAKIKIHRTKANTGEKGELKPGIDIQCNYKEMRVNISADSFDKGNVAMSLMELLIVFVTRNLAPGSTPSMSLSRDITNVPSQSQEGPLLMQSLSLWKIKLWCNQ